MDSPAPPRFDTGATVTASDGEVGTVDEVVVDPATGEPSLLAVRLREGGRRVEVPFGMVDAASSDPRHVRLLAERSMLMLGESVATPVETARETVIAEGEITASTLDAAGDRIVIPTHEEVLVPSTREVEIGTVRVHKRVETFPYETLVDVMHDDVSVERVPMGHPITAVPAPRHEGNTLVIPVVEEEVIIEKRLVLREEIRVTRRQVTEQVPVRDTLRREVVEIEDPDGGSFRASGESASSPAAIGSTAVEPDAADDLPVS